MNIAFVVFNRPETTRRVFAEIRRARPSRLFLIADGPRPGKDGESEKCAAVRDILDNGVDWDCDIYRNYSDVNLGCRNRPSSGLNWVFEHVESCIILEDDCVPHPSFFPYCQELLEKYLHDTRIMSISGDNFQFGTRRTPYSYYFSDIPHIWGWATWRRAWAKYDIGLQLWPEIKQGRRLRDLFSSKEQMQHWARLFDDSFAGYDTWDYQWTFSCLIHHGLCILPAVNLVSNVGFGEGATHTVREGIESGLPTEEMMFPLSHPPFMIRDREANDFTFKLIHGSGTAGRIKQFIKRVLS